MVKAGKIQIIKYAPPPSELPIFGRIDPADVSFIGRTNYVAALEEKRFISGIKRIDRRNHLYIIGKSGVGKSKLLELLIRQDITFGHGLCLMDQHMEVLKDVLDFIPENRIEDVVMIDPADINHPIAFNPLANVAPIFRHQLAQGLIEVMEKQFGDNWTSRLEHIFRFAVLALLDYPQATLHGIIAMLTDGGYRKKVAPFIEDDMVKRFWEIEFAGWAEKFDTDAIIPIVNKIGQFLSDPLLRNIFKHQENKLKFDELIGDKKIILVNLSRGLLGDENSGFFGSLLLMGLRQAGIARAVMPEKDRHDFYLYIEDFHNLATPTFENLLSESRRYGFCFTLTHQYLRQLAPAMHAAVLSNIANLIIFRVGAEDALKLHSEMTPIFEVKDMINLGMQEFYIKMTIDGEIFDPFSAETLKVLPVAHPSYKNRIIESSRLKYAVFPAPTA